MQSNHSNGSRASVTRGFAALCAMLAIGLASMALPVTADPFAYIANTDSNNVSVIDTATNTVVTTIPVGNSPNAVAVTPDGKHAYVANYSDNTVSVIRKATNTVVATVPVGNSPFGVAIALDGKHAYVSNLGSANVSVIATATKTVVATVAVGAHPTGVAVTPDGTHAYVANYFDDTVSVIDTATNMVVATIPVGVYPYGVAITPDGKHVYVANYGSLFTTPGNDVSVIATATNTVVATVTLTDFFSFPTAVAITPDGTLAYVTSFGIFDGPGTTVSVIGTVSNTVVATVPVGSFPNGVAVTPDGKQAYVANFGSNNVSVIATASNTVVATVAVGTGTGPIAVGIVPPPPGVPFLAFSVTALDIDFDGAPTFNLHSQFTLSSTAPGFHLHLKPVTLQVGTFSTTIPPASFAKQPDGSFFFEGVINGVSLKARITPTGTLQYTFHAKATGASLTGTKNKVYVTLIIGGDSGATSVTAAISP